MTFLPLLQKKFTVSRRIPMLRTFRSSITSLMSSSLILRLGLWRGRRVCAVSPFFPFAFIFIVSFCLSVKAISMNLTINYLYQNRISNPETSYKFEKKHLIQNYLDHRQKIWRDGSRASVKETDGNISILPVAIRIFQGTKKLVVKML